MRRCLAVLALSLLLQAGGLAEVYEGTTAALLTVTAAADAAGLAGEPGVTAGQWVAAGDTLVQLASERTFASQDGTVSLVYAVEGDEVDGTLLEIMPMERYVIYCTVESAYQSAASTLVHSGETLYIRCTANGTHRAYGIVTEIDGAEYRVLTLGGELYVGETVYLYRDDSFTTSQRVGIGTVLVNDTEAYAAAGKLTRLYVAEGDEVERGELIYETDGGTVAAPVAGIVLSVAVEAGQTVRRTQAVAEIVPAEEIGVTLEVAERAAAQIRAGDAAEVTFEARDEDAAVSGTVVSVAALDSGGGYTVRIRLDETDGLALGMRALVRLPASG